MKRIERLTQENERLRELVESQRFINQLSNQFSTPATSAKQRATQPVKLFYSYTHKDEEFRDLLDIHLRLLQRQGLIETWHDRRIKPGGDGEGEFAEDINTADIILFLVSADFLASDYCYGVEVARALERHAMGEARVIPVILRPAIWESSPFGKLQALPTDGRPISTWSDSDSAFRSIAEGIEAVARAMKGI